MNYDVVIAGGGPAGLVTAERVARAGLKTILFEKNETIGTPVHTSGGSWVSAMREHNVPPSLYHPVQRIRLMTTRGETQFDCTDPLPCVIDVTRFYQYLAERAIAAGAEIQLRSTVEYPLTNQGACVGVRVQDSSSGAQDVSAKIIVDASGYVSSISKRAGVQSTFAHFGLGVEYDVHAPRFDETEVLLIVGEQIAPNGYGWAFPYGNHRVRVGVGVPRPPKDIDPQKFLTELPKEIPALAHALEGSTIVEVHRGLIPFCAPSSARLVGDGLVVVGDAAGQNSTLAGEGIRFALDAGQFAGDTIVEAFSAGDYSAQFLRRYEARWNKSYKRKLWLAFKIHYRMMEFSDADWNEGLQLLQRLSPSQFVQLLKNDFTPSLFLELALRQTSFVISTIRFLLKPRASYNPIT